MAYRLRVAPRERRMVAHGLVESVWPAAGAVLVHEGIAYATAGRSTEADGGIALVAFRPETGETVWAKGLGEKTALIGTPYYAPMEQFGGDSPDVRSDIYNLATVLYECATGVLPWTGSSFLEVFQSKLKDAPPMKSRAKDVEVPAPLEAAILHGCQADRRKRFASARDFQLALNGKG